jgi:hypothetical protein
MSYCWWAAENQKMRQRFRAWDNGRCAGVA